ncbi:hypothetical protein ACIQTT_09395 [Microbacterium sp. NPDC090225]|uniref:hypothetical protein n=1 Tax=Microbacterium sp. NPDC090225 TaxID=3364207 RepID=UPI00380027B8
MANRLFPSQLFRGHWKSLSDYRDRRPTPDRLTRGILLLVPVLSATAVWVFGGTLASPGALLSGIALLAGALLAAFAQVSNLRFRLTERMRELPDAEQLDRDALDETASHLLVAAYLSAFTALWLVLAMNWGLNESGAVYGPWAALVVLFAVYVLLTFLIAIPRLYTAYVTYNSVRAELSGTHRG